MLCFTVYYGCRFKVDCFVVVYIAEDEFEEPDFQFIPDGVPALTLDRDVLAGSLEQLRDGLASGVVMTQFEVS